MMKRLGKEWSELSDEQKVPFTDLANKGTIFYSPFTVMIIYMSSVLTSQIY